MTDQGLDDVVVVGGGLAAARVCQQLRRQGYDRRVTLVSAEERPPYDRPPLSKDVLAGRRDDTTLNVDFDKLAVDLRLGCTATALRTGDRVVETTAGDIPYGALVIATGASPIRLPGDGEQLTLRTLDDARALRQRLSQGRTVVIVGASWIGAEVATAARDRGCRVVCVESASVPLASSVGEEVAKRLLSWWEGVDLRLGLGVEHVADGGVALSDGTFVDADVVVAGVGVRPDTGWLSGSGLTLDRGVVAVDEWLRAAPGIVAVGDVAAWWSRRQARHMRVEHWDDAATGPATAVRSLLEPPAEHHEVYDPVPYFWSDQFGHKLQYVGSHGAGDAVVWREWGTGWSANWVTVAGRLSAALVVDKPREMVAARKAIDSGMLIDPDRLSDPAIAIPEAEAELSG